MSGKNEKDLPESTRIIPDAPSKFQGRTNRIIESQYGDPSYIEIHHERVTYQVDFAISMEQLAEVKQLDDELFKGQIGIGMDELVDITHHGSILMLRDEAGNLIGESQVITSPIADHPNLEENEVYCYGTAVIPDQRGRGYAQVLFKAQEVVARNLLFKPPTYTEAPESGEQTPHYEYHKTRLTLVVRPENASSIRSRLHLGYRIVGYDATRYGATTNGGGRFLMEKSLTSEPLPFVVTKQIQGLRNGDTYLVNDDNIESVLQNEPLDLAVSIRSGESTDLTAHQLVERLLEKGYIGVGLLRPDEYGETPSDESLLIFQKKDSYPVVERLTLPLHVPNDYGKLREVIVSYSPVSAFINPNDGNNAVVVANWMTYDTLAAHDEHENLVKTLRENGVSIIRTSSFPAIDAVGKTGLFTRDPAVVLGNTFVVGHMERKSRIYETAGMIRIAKGLQQMTIEEGEDHAVVEGGDIIPLDETMVLVGLGKNPTYHRTNEAGLRQLRTSFPDINFYPVPHQDLHLDVLCTVLGERKVLADITKLPGELLEYLRQKGFEIVVADPEEQEPLGCNVLAIDNYKVIAVKENPITNARLRQAGVEVIEVSMPNLIKKGGGPRCLTCPTYRD